MSAAGLLRRRCRNVPVPEFARESPDLTRSGLPTASRVHAGFRRLYRRGVAIPGRRAPARATPACKLHGRLELPFCLTQLDSVGRESGIGEGFPDTEPGLTRRGRIR